MPKWYFPFWSKAEIYRTAELTVGKERFQNMTDADLKKFCHTTVFTANPPQATLYGFGIEKTYDVFPSQVRPGVVELSSEKDANGKRGS
jgi:hypothetical protein